jgi:hypothetical protein
MSRATGREGWTSTIYIGGRLPTRPTVIAHGRDTIREHPQKKGTMMTTRSSHRAIAGLMGGTMLLAGSLLSGSSASAQPTQTEVKDTAKQDAVRGQKKWQSMTSENQQKVKAKGEADVQAGKAKWKAATPEAQQQMKERGTADVQKGRKEWQSLPK